MVSFYLHFLCCFFLSVFCIVIWYQVFLSYTNNLYIWFQVFLSNTDNYMVSSNYFYLIIAICLYTDIYFRVTNNNTYLIRASSNYSLYKQFSHVVSSISIKYRQFLNRSIRPINRNLTGTTTPGQRGPGSNDNKGLVWFGFMAYQPLLVI